MTRLIILSAYVFFFPLIQWLGNLPVSPPVEPWVVDKTILLENWIWYDKIGTVVKPVQTGPRTWRFEETGKTYLIKHDYKSTRCVTITFYSDGHATVSAGEQ